MDAQDPPLAPDELLGVAGERELLAGFLDLYRTIVVRKVNGLSEQDARRRLVTSPTMLAGVIAHLSEVETEWFQRHLASRPPGHLRRLASRPRPDRARDRIPGSMRRVTADHRRRGT